MSAVEKGSKRMSLTLTCVNNVDPLIFEDKSLDLLLFGYYLRGRRKQV